MIKELLHGADYAAKGWRAFCNDRNAWKYAVLPFLILLLFYGGIFWGFFALTGKAVSAFQEVSLPGWLEWLHAFFSGISGFLAVLGGILFIAVTFCAFYELTGEFFFDALLEYYEKKKFGQLPCPMPLKTHFRHNLGIAGSALLTLLLSLLLSLASLFFPVLGQLVFIAVLGKRLGRAYLVNPAFNSGIPNHEFRITTREQQYIVNGFGTTIAILQFFPFINLLLLPGIVLGGTELFHNELQKDR